MRKNAFALVLGLSCLGTLIHSQPSFAAPATILYTGPTSLYPSLQDAITAVRPGGTVKIAPGIHNEPPVVISGKAVRIVGLKSGTQVAQIKLSSGSEIFHIASKANVSISNLEISGGSYGIVSAGIDAADAPIVTLTNVAVSGAKYGILLPVAKRATLTHCRTSGTYSLGLFLANFESAVIKGGDYSLSNGFGIAIHADVQPGYAPTGSVKIMGVTVANNRGGGITVSGAAKPVSIASSWIGGNDSVGILARNARLTITGSHVSYNNRDYNGAFGDGIIATESTLTLNRDAFVENERNGISVVSCSGIPTTLNYSSSLFDYNASEAIEGYLTSACAGSASVSELPGKGNLCRDGHFTGNLNCALHQTGTESGLPPGY